MIAQENKQNKTIPVRWIEKKTRIVKIKLLCITDVEDQGRMSFCGQRK